MSGGSWDYFYGKLDEVVDRLEGSPEPERRALGKCLKPFVDALYVIEWVDSGDKKAGDELAAIDKAIGKAAPMVIFGEAAKDVEVASLRLVHSLAALRANAPDGHEAKQG